jgi:hypothetical protein
MSLPAPHCRDDTAGAAARVIELFTEEPFKVAVRVAVPPEERVFAVAVKAMLLFPDGTVTDDGTVRFEELDEMPTSVFAPTSAFKLTVQTADPPDNTAVGLQAKLLTIGGALCGTLIVPPVAETAIGAPAREAPLVFLMAIDPVAGLAASPTLTTATTPFPSVLALLP